MTASSLAQKDKQYLLHPYTDAISHQEKGPLIIERGEGIFVFDELGKDYIEGMSGLWSVALGCVKISAEIQRARC